MKCCEKLVLPHINILAPHQFAFRANRSTKDVISTVLHAHLTSRSECCLLISVQHLTHCCHASNNDNCIQKRGVSAACSEVFLSCSHLLRLAEHAVSVCIMSVWLRCRDGAQSGSVSIILCAGWPAMTWKVFFVASYATLDDSMMFYSLNKTRLTCFCCPLLVSVI